METIDIHLTSTRLEDQKERRRKSRTRRIERLFSYLFLMTLISPLIQILLVEAHVLPHSHHHHHNNQHQNISTSSTLQPSYLTYDRQFEGLLLSPDLNNPTTNISKLIADDQAALPKRTYPVWILFHALGMSLAWFVWLPLAIVTSGSRNSSCHLISRLGFMVTLSLSILSGMVYRSLTPKLYEGETHSTLGWILVLAALISSITGLSPLWMAFKARFEHRTLSQYRSVPLADNTCDHASQSSGQSEFPNHSTKACSFPTNEALLKLFQGLADRLLVVLASAATISGAVIYTGACRASYVNGCLAHFIKGGIFFWYGILNWIRYLGGFSELGWPWHELNNKKEGAPSAEMVESAVVFLYGITNVWMERFGVKSGAPFTVKQVQHISIAAMFAFGGLVGILLETRGVRRLLFGGQETATSNPFPTLCITITGLAMSAHVQEFPFQVAIHTLWGVLLALFGVMRWMTYALLTKRSGPPVTEALGSLFLISGGTVFIESVEEITLAAIRNGFDDVMAFLNVTVAFVCLVMAWTMILMTIKRKFT